MKRKSLTAVMIIAMLATTLSACSSEKATPSEQPTVQAEPATSAENSPEAEPNSEPKDSPDSPESPESKSEPSTDSKKDTTSSIKPVGQTSIEDPAPLNEWLETKRYSPVDDSYHTVYYRITDIIRGSQSDEVQAYVDTYNAEDHLSTFKAIEDPNLEYCLLKYEVEFPADFPQADYGITSVNLDFSITTEEGGGIDVNGTSYIGLSSVYDTTKKPDLNEFYAGQTFTKGEAVFAMVKDFSDYVIKTDYRIDDTKFESFVAGK